ncbi:MAG TPA: glycosyltransferase family 4 protein [Deltaproteobacteria bacterium]|nr:glycosyltransferase family 4 protein [Deltaproteobacteria bacterium]HON62268.1 glycosyltransferase family 4 protein [Deltaproteobacteria bacterium]HPA85839.1 glycosyltransferase family 4 protein [Deltaproteobacteria bacterium]HPW69860.1 glycosyltransferase family 4 protein [Deltaproteobacteria bacterium]
MANWWAVHEREVAVLTLNSTCADHYPLHPGVQRIRFDWSIPRTRVHIPVQYVRQQIMIRRAVLDYNPGVVISFIDRTNIRMLLALAGSGIPVIVSERIDPRYHDIGCYWSFVRRMLYPFSQALVVQTDPVAAWAYRVISLSRVRVIPNFVREMHVQGIMPEEREPVILAVGRLDKQKGHDLLIRAFARADAKQKGWRLVILGEGPERSNLWRLTEDLGIHDAVSMPGVVKEPAEWMYKADLFVLPSRYEGFPNALLEAMACGCAVIAADCPSGPAEIIRHGVNGLLVPRENITALSTAMDRLMQDEELRVNLGKQAIEISSRFSQAKIMAQWDDLIEDVCISPK